MRGRRRWYVWTGLAVVSVIIAVAVAVPQARRFMLILSLAALDRVRYERIHADSAARMIAATERLGAAHAAPAAEDSAQPGFPREHEVGSPARQCVDVGDAKGARSGEYWMHNFRMQYAFWINGGSAFRVQPKLLHDPRRDSVVVVVTRLDRLAPTKRFVMSGRPMGGGPAGYWFANSSILPGSGRWLIVTSGGPNWGCFIYQLPVFGQYWGLFEPGENSR